jgi:hypothetical protein
LFGIERSKISLVSFFMKSDHLLQKHLEIGDSHLFVYLFYRNWFPYHLTPLVILAPFFIHEVLLLLVECSTLHGLDACRSKKLDDFWSIGERFLPRRWSFLNRFG